MLLWQLNLAPNVQTGGVSLTLVGSLDVIASTDFPAYRFEVDWNNDGAFGALYEDITADTVSIETVGSSRVDLQACKLEYSIVSPK